MDNRCDCFKSIFEKTVCYGTKDREECKCGGDKSKCDFYSDKCKSEVKDISHAESLLLNFFNGEIYFVFEDEDEVNSFLEYIKFYDERYKEKEFECKENMKSAAWSFDRVLHKFYLIWQDETEYFKDKYKLKPISYSLVKERIDIENKTREFARTFFRWDV